jgi:uncharacterized membrane protein
MGVEFGKRNVRSEGSPAGGSTTQNATVNSSRAQGVSQDDWQGWLRMGAQIAAAALIGFGVILWVAAHWDDVGRFGRFAIVGGVLGASLLISLVNATRVPGLIGAVLATGGLFALIGPT